METNKWLTYADFQDMCFENKLFGISKITARWWKHTSVYTKLTQESLPEPFHMGLLCPFLPVCQEDEGKKYNQGTEPVFACHHQS